MTENVPSPCISVCRVDEVTGLCQGCWRNLDEIARWSTCSDLEKKHFWSLIEQRMTTHPPCKP